jgi:hypothetical protein
VSTIDTARVPIRSSVVWLLRLTAKMTPLLGRYRWNVRKPNVPPS